MLVERLLAGERRPAGIATEASVERGPEYFRLRLPLGLLLFLLVLKVRLFACAGRTSSRVPVFAFFVCRICAERLYDVALVAGLFDIAR